MSSYIENLKDIYDEMRVRNLASIKSNGFKYDTELSHQIDTRRCFAIYNIIEKKCNNQLNETFFNLLDVLKTLFQNHIVYDIEESTESKSARFHHTFLQIVTFNQSEDLKKEYAEKTLFSLKKLVGAVPKYKIHYNGLICLPHGLCLVGIPSIDLNSQRQNVRDQLAFLQYPALESFHLNIIHSTILRFSKEISDIERSNIFDIANQYKDFDFGTIFIDNLCIGNASWKMNDLELNVYNNNFKTQCVSLTE